MLQSIKAKQKGDTEREIRAFETQFEQQQQGLQFKIFIGDSEMVLTKNTIRIISNTVS